MATAVLMKDHDARLVQLSPKVTPRIVREIDRFQRDHDMHTRNEALRHIIIAGLRAEGYLPGSHEDDLT